VREGVLGKCIIKENNEDLMVKDFDFKTDDFKTNITDEQFKEIYEKEMEYRDNFINFTVYNKNGEEIFDRNTYKNSNVYEKIDKVLVDTLNELNELYNRKSGITGLATGLVDFDRKTTGLKKSSLIILAARPRYG